MLFRRCNAGLRRRHQGHRVRRKPLADKLRMLRAARKDDAVTVGDRQHAAGQEWRSGLPELATDVLTGVRDRVRPPARRCDPDTHRGERQCEWQKAAADTGRGRKPAGGEALGGASHRGSIAADRRLATCSAGSEVQRSCRPHRAARQTRTSAGCAGSRAAVRCTSAATSRTSSNCATAPSNVRAPSAMLSMSPFSSCACCSDKSPSCARRSAQWLYSTHTPAAMTGSRQVSTTNNSRVDSRILRQLRRMSVCRAAWIAAHLNRRDSSGTAVRPAAHGPPRTQEIASRVAAAE